MKKQLLIILSLCFSIIVQAQVLKTINVITAGSLNTLLTQKEDTSITNLTITGTIDARDFVTMRDSLTKLEMLDLNNVDIVAYKGKKGTNSSDSIYPSNTIPTLAFNYESKNGTGKQSLISIIIPSTVTMIGFGAFLMCNNLISVTIPSSVTVIGGSAFNFCSGLSRIKIPSSVTSILPDAFYGCTGLTSIIIPSSVKYMGSFAFNGCSHLTLITIPTSVTYIANDAFSDCQSLISVSIPSTVTSISDNAFVNDTSLQSIYVSSSTPIDLSSSNLVFDGVKMDTCILYVPFGSKSAYQAAPIWNSFHYIIELSGYWNTDSTIILPATSNNTMPIVVQTDGIWDGSCNVSWITLKPIYNGTEIYSLIITAQANTTGESRTGIVTLISDGTISLKNDHLKTISVTQLGTTANSMVIASPVTLFPNPATTSFTINIESTATVQVYTTEGITVLSKQITDKENIPISNLPTGIYVVKIITVDTVITKTLIVE
jgi:hypothetical protein